VTPPSPEQTFLSTALQLAQTAAQEILGFLHQPIATQRKDDLSIVTEADLRSDQVLRDGLKSTFPDHGILTEEQGLVRDPSSEYVWLIDPLDGTKAFAKGISGFCVMVGLLKNKIPQLGVVVDPLEGHIYEAIRGGGAYHTLNGNRTQVHVSKRAIFDQMPVITSTGLSEKVQKQIREEIPSPFLPPINSVGIKVGQLVRQVADIYINHHSVHFWDTCAPQIILEEAGGVFTQIDGRPLQYSLQPPYSHQSKTVASNGKRHQELVEILKEVQW
jgi:3'(2'), 5'-bisphosphate nucleotidase